MKSKSSVIYLVLIILLVVLTTVSGYYAKSDWLKGQLGQLYQQTVSTGSPVAESATSEVKAKVKRSDTAVPSSAAEKTVAIPVTQQSAPCTGDSSATSPAVYCLHASLQSWDPSNGKISFIYTLEGLKTSGTLHAGVYDRSGALVYGFPDRTDTSNGANYIDMWRGLDEKGEIARPGHYRYSVSGEATGAGKITDASVDFEII